MRSTVPFSHSPLCAKAHGACSSDDCMTHENTTCTNATTRFKRGSKTKYIYDIYCENSLDNCCIFSVLFECNWLLLPHNIEKGSGGERLVGTNNQKMEKWPNQGKKKMLAGNNARGCSCKVSPTYIWGILVDVVAAVIMAVVRKKVI